MVIVALLAVALLVSGVLLFLASGPGLSPEPQQGSVSVLTDDPDASVEMKYDVSAYRFDGPIERNPLSLEIIIVPSTGRPLRWAVVLDGGAALPYSPTAIAAGSALPGSGNRAQDEVWAQGDFREAWFARDAGLDLRVGATTPRTSSSVIVGVAEPDQEGEIAVRIVGPSEQPPLTDERESYSLRLPRLGSPYQGTPQQSLERFREQRDISQHLVLGTFLAPDVDSDIKNLIEETSWRLPTTYSLEAEVFDQSPGDRLVFVNEPPASPTAWSWSGRDLLEIQGVASRPYIEVRNDRLQFAAGVIAGIAGGFVVWTLELLYELRTSWRSRRVPRALPTGSRNRDTGEPQGDQLG